jgi:hypothetical protein
MSSRESSFKAARLVKPSVRLIEQFERDSFQAWLIGEGGGDAFLVGHPDFERGDVGVERGAEVGAQLAIDGLMQLPVGPPAHAGDQQGEEQRDQPDVFPTHHARSIRHSQTRAGRKSFNGFARERFAT